MDKEKLIDRVLEEIKLDIEMGDLTAIAELLEFCPEENLRGYLPETETHMDYDTNDVVVYVPLFRIVQNDAACNALGINPYCVNEGADGSDLFCIKLTKAQEWGLV